MYEDIHNEFLLFVKYIQNEYFLCLHNNTFDPNWVTAIGTSLLAFATFVLAFWGTFLSYIQRPILKIFFKRESPYCIKIPKELLDDIHPHGRFSAFHYFRFGVINNGKRPAKKVEVYANKLYKMNINGDYIEQKGFIPMNLCWQDHQKCITLSILPGMQRLCNLGHIIDPNNQIAFNQSPINGPILDPENKPLAVLFIEVETPLKSRGHIIENGKYQLNLLIGASNVKPRNEVIEFELSGLWDLDEDIMYEKGMIIKEIVY